MNVQYTLVITSCNRHDLLSKTLDSFRKFADIAPIATVIVEDSDVDPLFHCKELSDPFFGQVSVIVNKTRRGQIYSCDRAMAEVKTEYVFWCEDDWEFTKTGFVGKSLSILENNPKIIQVNLRTDWQHPIIKKRLDTDITAFDIVQPNWDGGWGGFSFNPGLRRYSDYRAIGSYGKHVGYNPYEVGELYLSKLYLTLGFNIASLPECPYVQHIGWGSKHVDWATAPKPPKVLIAILACHKYSMGENQHELVRNTLRPVGVDKQLEACRNTWVKDLAPFKSYVTYKFFYGGNSNPPRQPLEDEVFLEDCGDTYVDLPQKTRAICKWALANGYEYLFKCDDDTYIHVDRLLASNYQDHDYAGNVIGGPPSHKYCGGGVGYWLSTRAMNHIASQGKPKYPPTWAEDFWVGSILDKAGIVPHNDTRYKTGGSNHWVDMDAIKNVDYDCITFHACKPENLFELHSRILGPSFTVLDETGQIDEVKILLDKFLIKDGQLPDLNKETKNSINLTLERLIKTMVTNGKRISELEEKIERFNRKSPQKII